MANQTDREYHILMEEMLLFADYRQKAGMQCQRCYEAWIVADLQEAVVTWNEHHCLT